MQINEDDAIPSTDLPYVVPVTELEDKLLNSGLLFAINRLVLHPAGMALALVYSDEGVLQSLELVQTHNNEPWKFDPELEKQCIEKLRNHGAARLLEFIKDGAVGISPSVQKEGDLK
jgi:hypothetical protein